MGEDSLEECNIFSHFSHQYDLGFHEAVVCNKVNKDPNDDLEELRHLSLNESEGERKIKEDPICDAPHLNPLKVKTMDIGTKEKPKLASIRDYWDDHTMREIFYLLE